MKRIIFLTVAFAAALALIAACTQAAPTATEAPPSVEEATEAETEAYPVETPAEITTEAYPVETETEVTEATDEAEALIIQRCSDCHSVDRVFNADKTAEEWDENIDRMIDYGAEVSDEEKAIMIDWLTTRDN